MKTVERGRVYTSKSKQDGINSWFHALDYTDVALNLFMAGWFLRLWIAPHVDDANDIYSLSVLLAFEILMLHSGTFMALFPPKWSILVFIPAYGLFAWAYSHALEDNFVMWVYLIVVLNRMRFAFFNKNIGLRMRTVKSSFICAFIYIGVLGIVYAVRSKLPVFGLTTAFLEEARPKDPLLFGNTVFVVAFGAAYYICLAIFNLWVSRNPEKLEKDM